MVVVHIMLFIHVGCACPHHHLDSVSLHLVPESWRWCTVFTVLAAVLWILDAPTNSSGNTGNSLSEANYKYNQRISKDYHTDMHAITV